MKKKTALIIPFVITFLTMGLSTQRSLLKTNASSDNVVLSNCIITDISAGVNHNLALDQYGNLWAWGENNKGQLGDGTTTNSNVPIQIMRGHKFKKISAGNGVSAAIDVNNFLYTWGDSFNLTGEQQLIPTQASTDYVYDVKVGSNITQISKNPNFSFIGYSISKIELYNTYCEEEKNTYINNTVNTKYPHIDSLTPYYPSYSKNQSGQGGKFTAFGYFVNNSLNNNYICFDGLTWGRFYSPSNANTYGSSLYISMVSDFFAVNKNGTIEYIHNDGYYAPINEGIPTLFDAINISTLSNIKNCSVRKSLESHTGAAFFVSKDGNAYAVGSNGGSYNLLGSESTIGMTESETPCEIAFPTRIEKISGGKNHVLALDANGKVYAWGNNQHGQLGLGDNDNRSTPTLIPLLNQTKSFNHVAFCGETSTGSFEQLNGSNYQIIQNGSKGNLILDSTTGDFSYTSTSGQCGQDTIVISITYASVTIEYQVNIYIDNKPVFFGGTSSLNVECGQTVNGNAPATDLDGDQLIYSISEEPTKGVVTLTNNNGDFAYTARTDVAGGDSFILSVSDGYCTVQYPVSVHVHSLITTNDDTEFEIDLNSNDRYSGNVNALDIDGDTLGYSVFKNGSKGTVQIDSDGNYTYIANGTYYGEDTFTIRIDDGYRPLDVVYTVHLYSVVDGGTILAAKITKGTVYNGEIKTNANGATPIYSIYQQASNGQVEIDEESGKYTYIPNEESIGDDCFVVLVDYGYGQYTATIHVYQNTIPNASAVTVTLTTNQNTNYVGSAQCVDVDGDMLSYSINTQPLKGSLSLNSTTGEYVYYPNTNVAGNDIFKVDVDDGTDTITINFNIHIESEISVEEDVYKTISQNTSLSDSLNVSDLDGDTLVYSINSSAAHGVANVDSLTGSFIYVPFTNFYGSDSFSIKVDDGVLAKICTIHIVVNRQPIADQITINLTTQGVTVTGTAQCSDPDGDVLMYSIIEEPNSGSAIVDANNGAFAYTPDLGAAGDDSFKIKVTDGVDDIIVKINIHNETDVELSDQATTLIVNQGKSTTGQVYAVDLDGDALTYSITDYPTQGTVNLNSSTGAWTYNAKSNAAGIDAFSIRITDGRSEVVINYVLIVNTPASFEEDTYSIITNQNNNYSGQVTAFDADGDALTFSIVAQGQKGTVTIDPSTGRYLYVPNENEAGNDNFVVGVSDGNFTTEVEINVHIESEVTVASSTIAHETEKNGVVLGNVNALDLDGDSLTYAIYQQGYKGNAVVMGDGSYSYFANNGAGDDSFVISVSDGLHVVYVTIYIHIGSDPYFEESVINISVPQNGSTTGQVHGIDEDGDALSYSISTQPVNGSVNLNSSTGEFTYSAYSNSTASSDSFIVAATDGKKTSYVTVSVIINNAPKVSDSSISISQGGSGSGRITATDAENDLLSYSITSQGGYGNANINSSTGEFTYTITDRDFSGIDSFTVSVSDGYTTKYVVVKVEVVKNAKPTSTGTTIEVNSGSSTTSKLNVTDLENDALTYSITFQGDKGTAFIDEKTGEFTYSANKDTSGYDCFVVTVSDGFNTTSFLVEVNINFVDSNNSWAIPTTIVISSVAALSIVGLTFILLKFRKKIFVK